MVYTTYHHYKTSVYSMRIPVVNLDTQCEDEWTLTGGFDHVHVSIGRGTVRQAGAQWRRYVSLVQVQVSVPHLQSDFYPEIIRLKLVFLTAQRSISQYLDIFVLKFNLFIYHWNPLSFPAWLPVGVWSCPCLLTAWLKHSVTPSANKALVSQ